MLWVSASDSGQAPALVFDAEPGARGNPAAACEFILPTDPSAIASRELDAHFCGAIAGPYSTARLILTSPGGANAKLKIVAFAPSATDSMEGTTVCSEELTLNGGCVGNYPPVVCRATSTHHLGRLDVRLVGANLLKVTSVPISAHDSSWTYPLEVSSRSDSQVTAHALLAAPLPEIVVGAQDELGGVGASTIPADNFPPLSPQFCSATFEGSSDTTGMQPKDFAFLDAGDSWHVFYTRQYQTSNYTDQSNTRRIGHAVSTDQHLNSWTVVDRSAIQVRPGKIWDNLHVWAPTIVRKPGDITYYMFYTGVQLDTLSQPPNLRTSEIQRIGIATSVDLNTWTQDATPVYSNKRTSWAFRDSSHNVVQISPTQFYSDTWQFRDPFVMQDPDNPGKWLLYFAAIDSTLNKYVVGLARTQGTDLRVWQDVWPLRRTSAAFMNASRDESPHAFKRNGKWWLLYTSNHVDGDQITFTLTANSPADSAGWLRPDSLKAITCGQHGFPSSLNQWHATEYVGIGSHEYLSAFADNLFGGGVIQFTQIVHPDATCPTDSILLSCPDVWTDVAPNAGARTDKPVSLLLSGASPARGSASLRLTLADRGRIHLAIYDVFGRRVRSLLDGWVPAGLTTVAWDGRGDQGAVTTSGIYFARATGTRGRAVVRIPLLH